MPGQTKIGAHERGKGAGPFEYILLSGLKMDFSHIFLLHLLFASLWAKSKASAAKGAKIYGYSRLVEHVGYEDNLIDCIGMLAK